MEKFIKTGCVVCMLLLTGALCLKTTDIPVLISVNANGRLLPIYCVETDGPFLSISFDAAWGADETDRILSILDAHQIKASFFLTGDWVDAYPDKVKAIADAGHDLGNHSANHEHMTQLSDDQIRSELMTVHEKVKALTGVDMCLFRPPYGEYDNRVITGAQSCGYYTIQWSVDSLDWKNYGVQSIIDTVTGHENLDAGAIILCHNDGKYTADALDGLLTILEEKGYAFVPISRLIHRDNYHMDVTGRQIPDTEP